MTFLWLILFLFDVKLIIFLQPSDFDSNEVFNDLDEEAYFTDYIEETFYDDDLSEDFFDELVQVDLRSI